MPVKFEWDLDSGSGDLQYCFHLDNVLNSSGGDVEAEFFFPNPRISPALPNDDIWKKFDMTDEFDYEELDDILGDMTTLAWTNPMYESQSMAKDAREIRNHDCMWAGHCISEKHDKNNQKTQKCISLLPLKKTPPPSSSSSSSSSQSSEEPKVLAISSATGGKASADSNKVCIRKNAVVAPTHARSLLLPTRVVNGAPSKGVQPGKSGGKATSSRFRGKIGGLDSAGESPRPETPQSLSDNEDLNLDLPDIKTVEEFAVDTFGYNFVSDIVNNVGNDAINGNGDGEDFDLYLEAIGGGEVASGKTHLESPAKLTVTKLNRNNVKQEVPMTRYYAGHSFFSDHCYHLSKSARMDNLGVQTPSDSEEEIDVETVYGESKKPSSRSNSSSGGVLPTNPSFSDRQQIQLTVASAMSKKDMKRQSARTASVPPRFSLDERTLKPKTLNCKRKVNVRSETRRTGGMGSGSGGNKQSPQFDDYGDQLSKSVKRRKYQYQRHFKNPKSKKPRNRRNCSRNGDGGGCGSSGFGSDSGFDSSEKRTIHNTMERQRRIDLRNAFEELRKLVPFTAGNEKAPKVVILSYGAEFCKSLTVEEAELTRKKAELRRQQEMLRAKVSQLRRSLAARR